MDQRMSMLHFAAVVHTHSAAQHYCFFGQNSVSIFRARIVNEFTVAIRNTSSPHWRGWLKPESRCLVPVNSFSEYAPEPNPETKKKDVVWFALEESRPMFCFAGIWTTFNGDRGTKSKPIP